ncbi:MAG: hypothetical protein ACK55I_21070, partial [bacterium]
QREPGDPLAVARLADESHEVVPVAQAEASLVLHGHVRAALALAFRRGRVPVLADLGDQLVPVHGRILLLGRIGGVAALLVLELLLELLRALLGPVPAVVLPLEVRDVEGADQHHVDVDLAEAHDLVGAVEVFAQNLGDVAVLLARELRLLEALERLEQAPVLLEALGRGEQVLLRGEDVDGEVGPLHRLLQVADGLLLLVARQEDALAR